MAKVETTTTYTSMENGDMKMGKMCGCGCHKVMPILIIILGLDLLLGMVGAISWEIVNIVWPILIIVAGCVKLGKRSCGCWAQHESKM